MGIKKDAFLFFFIFGISSYLSKGQDSKSLRNETWKFDASFSTNTLNPSFNFTSNLDSLQNFLNNIDDLDREIVLRCNFKIDSQVLSKREVELKINSAGINCEIWINGTSLEGHSKRNSSCKTYEIFSLNALLEQGLNEVAFKIDVRTLKANQPNVNFEIIKRLMNSVELKSYNISINSFLVNATVSTGGKSSAMLFYDIDFKPSDFADDNWPEIQCWVDEKMVASFPVQILEEGKKEEWPFFELPEKPTLKPWQFELKLVQNKKVLQGLSQPLFVKQLGITADQKHFLKFGKKIVINWQYIRKIPENSQDSLLIMLLKLKRIGVNMLVFPFEVLVNSPAILGICDSLELNVFVDFNLSSPLDKPDLFTKVVDWRNFLTTENYHPSLIGIIDGLNSENTQSINAGFYKQIQQINQTYLNGQILKIAKKKQ